MSQTVEPNRGTRPRPVGHAGAPVEIAERAAWTINGWAGVLFVLVCALLCVVLAGTSVRGVMAAPIVAGALVLSSLVIIQPGHTKVVRFFGNYVGTVRRAGLW